MLRELERPPPGLADCPAPGLAELLGGPTLLHLRGRRGRPLFLTVLQHGNETTGWEAMRGILRDFAHAELPRPLSVFIGNVAAARRGLRRLDGQPDYNRLWAGGDAPEHRMAERVYAAVRARRPCASIDVHNTTGPNPHYACVNTLEPRTLYLAGRFARTAVYSRVPPGMHSLRFSRLCPALTIECGLPARPEGVAHARAYLEQRLFEEALPAAPAADGLELFHTVAQVRIPAALSFGFGGGGADLRLDPGLADYNFREVPAGFEFGRWRAGRAARLAVADERGADAFDAYFVNRGGRLLARRPVVLSMLTLQEKIVEQDCLCYLMERLAPGAPAPA